MSPDEKETTFYSDEWGVRVTNTRLIVDHTTYAMANVASVTTAVAKPSRRGPLLLILVGGLILLAGAGEKSTAGAVFGAVLIGLGTLWWRGQKPVYHVRISSASGQSTAVSSRNRAYVERIVQAINEAIIRRG